jgi:hypothetical protein
MAELILSVRPADAVKVTDADRTTMLSEVRMMTTGRQKPWK